MADIFQDEFLTAEQGDMENFLFAPGGDDDDTIDAAVEEENKNDDKDSKEENEDSSDETKVESVNSFPHIPNLEELANSGFIRNRQLAAKSIVEYLNQAGSNKEALHSVISIMCKLSEDEDLMVRSELMEHIPSIAMFCKEHSEDLGMVIRQQIVPYTVKLLTDIQIQVRKVGHTTLLVLLENDIIDNSQLSEWICPLIAQLATAENNPEQLQHEDVSVLCKMIPYVGKEIAEKFLLEPFLSHCDSASSVKEVCMLHFGNISKVLGRETTETILLPVYLDLCEDLLRNMHCVDIAVDFAEVVSPTTRNEVLAPLYISFLQSKFRHVNYDAFRLLGKFISTFADPSKTGLCYKDSLWIDIPFEDDVMEDKQISDVNFECLTSKIISNPQFLDECSFIFININLNNCLTTDSSYTELKQKLSIINSKKEIEDNLNTNLEGTNIQNSVKCENKHLNHSLLTHPTTDSHLYHHVDNENLFNNFQFWRTPLPEVELEIDGETKSTNMNVHTKMLSEEDNEHECASEFFPSRIRLSRGKKFSTSTKKMLSEKDNKHKCASELNVNTSPKQSITDTVNSLLEDGKIIEFERTVKFDRRNTNFLMSNTISPPSEKESRRLIASQIITNGKSHMTVYDQNIVPPELLLEYVREFPHREDLKINMAYYFPSVAYTLGRKYWPCLRNVFDSLVEDFEFSVRKSVASFLHELAVILGQDITQRDLLPVFLEMFREEKLRAILLQHVAQFLRNLSPHSRKEFLPLIHSLCVWEEESNWRYRLTIAQQLIPCIELYSSCEALQFFPVPLKLLQDKISAVRKAAVELLAVIIKSMVTNSKSTDFLKAVLCALDEKYRKANKWLWRQMYVYICQELAVKKSLPTDFYVDHIVPNLFSLAYDTVPNVRLAVARCLGLALLPLDFLPSIQKAHYQLLLQVMYSLQSDVDKDVRYFAHLSTAAFNVLPPKKLSPA